MEKKLLALGSDAKLVIKSAEGKEVPVCRQASPRQGGEAVVYLLIDCSSSMGGEKIRQARQGALDFSQTAIRKGYRVGLIKFANDGQLICEPTTRFSLISVRVEELIAYGGTNLTEPLRMASQRLIGKSGGRLVVVATDGCPQDSFSALEIAGRMKKDRIEILAIATEDADQYFLSKLVSRSDLNLRVERNQFREAMSSLGQKLPRQAIEYKR